MESEIKSISSVQKEVVVLVERADIQREEDTILQSFARNAKIPGFRKGKVPLTLIKTRCVKELEEQLDKAVASKVYEDILKENQWDVFSLVRLDVKNTPEGDKELNFIVDLKPIFELIDYKNMEIDQPEIIVTDEESSNAIEQIRNHHAEYKEVKRPIQKGDFVRLQYTGRFEDDTNIIDLIPKKPMWAEQKNTWEEAGSEDASSIKVISDGIIGMEGDQEKDIEMDFPADFEVSELQAKKVIYHIKIFEVREKTLPELDNVFFEKVKVKDFDDLKEWLSGEIKKRKAQIQRFEQREEIVQKMLDSATFEVPESSVQYEQIHIIRNFVERQLHEGMTPEMIQNNKDKLYADSKDLAYDRAKVNFILEKIAEKENVVVNEKEIGQMIIQEASMLHMPPDQLISELKSNSERAQDLQRRALFGKTLDFVLVTNLKGNNLPGNLPGNSDPVEEYASEETSATNSTAASNLG
ncbi:MAG: trigger factor [Puniceicoccales bacterium]|nr:trigger factor [Puniceicoccales bacterium]